MTVASYSLDVCYNGGPYAAVTRAGKRGHTPPKARVTALISAAVLGLLAMLLPPPAAQAVTTPRVAVAYGWALTQHGCWYSYGSAGPCGYGYDCSGLVYAAYRYAGVGYFGRSTYGMLASGRLRRVWHPHPGELAFYGSGHVELYVNSTTTYGAQHSGTQVGYHRISTYWHPSAYYYVWGS